LSSCKIKSFIYRGLQETPLFTAAYKKHTATGRSTDFVPVAVFSQDPPPAATSTNTRRNQ
jgi:hypothetical protein